ncbi:MAG: VWA domain-containing protein [Gordonia sp. (in: high G+C Gram-positive bacteria)]|uniref:vWA domain-containing protein n=1 Tax=Gordonia sp. (in: high G+C Gram-positive bacteria) TaxID=84139 RepID=UPI0039E4F75B
MTVLPWERPPETLLGAADAALCRLWRDGAGFGLLLVGDAWQREQVYRWLRPDDAVTLTTATAVTDLTGDTAFGSGEPLLERAGRTCLLLPAADLLDHDVAALVDTDRILACAPDPESVDPALLSRLTCVVGLSVTPVLRACRQPSTGLDLPAWVVRTLAANDLHDHLLDIGAARCLTAAQGAGLPLNRILTRTIIEPRLAPMTDAALPDPAPVDSPPATATSGGADQMEELAADDADVARDPTPADPPASEPPPWADPAAARAYLDRRYPGRRGARTRTRRGRTRRTVDYRPDLGIDLPQTLRTIAMRGRSDPSVLRSAIRSRRAGRLTVIVVDRSDSMTGLRMKRAEALAGGALDEAARDRTLVALISARGAAAELVLEPTRDLREAARLIGRLPVGGGTPLASAFMLATGLVDDDQTARVIVLTDGGSNVRYDDPATDDERTALQQAEAALTVLSSRCEQVLVVPALNPGVRLRDADVAWMTRAGAVVRTVGPDSARYRV